MKNFYTEFKQFAMKGNIIELATAVIIGTAFGKVISSLVDNIIMPLLGVLLGGVRFSDKVIAIGNVQISYGVFIQSLVEFVIIALSIFVFLKVFKVVKAKVHVFEEEKKGSTPPTPPEEVLLLREIRDTLKREQR